MYQLVFVIHIFAAICIIALVLMQQGKGASIGAAFGSGASQTVFGSRGSGSFLLRMTIGFVVIFFSTSIALNNLAAHAMKQEAQSAIPVTTGSDTAPVSPNSIPVPSTSDQGSQK
jgi:preprotein translocase subunit SecG